MKKDILILMPSMFIGGAERSLIGLLDSIDYEKYNVDLFLNRHEGEFMSLIPNKVNLLPQIDAYTNFDRPIKDVLFSKNFKYGIARLKSKLDMKRNVKDGNQSNVWSSMQFISNRLVPLLPNIDKEYDLAISFLGIADVLGQKVKAKNKLAWIHTDYSKLIPNRDLDLDTYSKVDYIVTVSEHCEKQFLNVYPMLNNKSLVIENILSEKFIKIQAEEEVEDMQLDDSINLLSIGRFTDAKNFDNVPKICKNILEKRINVKWYIIGYGTDEELIKSKILEEKMQDNVILLGKKENPYPYIKNANYFCLLSEFEGYGMVLEEAKILNKPIIITNTAARECIENYPKALILENSEDEIYDGLYKLLNDNDDKIFNNTQTSTEYDNTEKLQKIIELVGD